MKDSNPVSPTTEAKPIYCPRRRQHAAICETPNACAGGADCRLGPDLSTRMNGAQNQTTDFDEWIECWNCGGEGEIEDEDWQFEGDFYTCDICDGRGGWKRHPGPHSVALDDDPGMM